MNFLRYKNTKAIYHNKSLLQNKGSINDAQTDCLQNIKSPFLESQCSAAYCITHIKGRLPKVIHTHKRVKS